MGHSDKVQVRSPDDSQMCGVLMLRLGSGGSQLAYHAGVLKQRGKGKWGWVHLKTTSNAQHKIAAGNHGRFC